MPSYPDIIDRTQAPASLDGGHLEELLSLFHRLCDDLGLEPHDAPTARTAARTIIEAALSGELDSDNLYQRALQAILVS